MSIKSLQLFLDMLVELVSANPDLIITDRLVYSQLISYHLGNGVIPFENIEKYFRNWITEFKNNPLIDVYRDKNNPFICRFSSKREFKNIIKIYVPLDAFHIKDGVIDIFSYLVKENIIHDSKVYSTIRNDNIIIKVSTIDDANKIIKYIKSNLYLSEGLLNMNPFLIPCYKVGVTSDNHYTYNVEVCHVIAVLLSELRSRGELEKLKVNYLRNTFTRLAIKCDDDELSELYQLASISLNSDLTLQDFANYVLEHQQLSYVNKHSSLNLDKQSSIDYLNFAILETFKRYNNLSFVINAVRVYITNGNTKGFTRMNRARQNLKLYADINLLKSLFESDNLDISIKYYILKIINNE